MHERLQLFERVIGVEKSIGGRVHGSESGDGCSEDYYETKAAPKENLKYRCFHCGGVGLFGC